jgi:DHA3 family macrolide efflux protein-like MFS transporter
MEISKAKKELGIIITKSNTFEHYLIFLLGQVFSIMGSAVVSFVIILWITYETGSALLLSFNSFFYLLPQIVITLISGVISDRYNKKLLILLTDFSQVLVTLSLFFFLSYGSSMFLIIIIMIVSALRSIFQAIQIPVVRSLIPLMVPEEKISRINGLNYFLSSFILIIAPLIATTLLSFLSINQVVFLDLFTFILAVLPLIFIKIPEIQNTNNEKVKKSFTFEFKEGFKAITKVRGLKSLIFLAMCNVLIKYPFHILFPLFIFKNHQGNEYNLAVFTAFVNAGFLLGSLITFIKKKWKHQLRIILSGLLIYYIFYLFITFAPKGLFLWIGVLALIANSSFPLIDSLYYTIIQTKVPKNKIGRVIAIDWSFSLLISPIGIILSGFLSEAFGIIPLFIFCSLTGISITSLIWLFSNLRYLDKKEVCD